MKKTAIVYDKWLASLGGGEVVACNMARVLKDAGYDVTFLAGKLIPPYIIKNALNIDLTDINFMQLWNDEAKLRSLCKGKDLFINTSFMDYSYGYAKKNLYYTHFPTEAYIDVKGFLFNSIMLPLATKFIKPLEFMSGPEGSLMKNGHYMHEISRKTTIAFSFLNTQKTYLMKFSIFIEDFTKTNLESYKWEIKNATITRKTISVNHHQNVINYNIHVKPESSTIYFEIGKKSAESSSIYLLYPKIIPFIMPDFLYRFLYEKLNSRLRAGLFNNLLRRLSSYNVILANSEFTKRWILKYWKRNSKVLYPPVTFIKPQSKIKKTKKIAHVGRFFTLGHGKRQEVLIEAFKKIYDQGKSDWELHLIGGKGNEPSSIIFCDRLKDLAKGYPIYFHFNASRKKMEEILLSSTIYWHATGYQESETKRPIKFEHFGIAVVEALSAGCIPIVYKAGGLPEIIFNSGLPDSLLFRSIEELVTKTLHVMDTLDPLQNVMTKKRIYLRKAFSSETFRKDFFAILNEKK